MDTDGALTETLLLETRDLRVAFRGRRGTRHTVRAVDGVSLRIRAGETLGLVGESGSGKSTLGRAMLVLEEPTGGTVVYDGIDLGATSERQRRALRHRMQIVFQDPYGSLNPRQPISRTLSTPLRIHKAYTKRDVSQRVTDLLELVGLDGRDAAKYPHEFSGGQRQRIGIARALSVEPEFLVCDEPVSALDVSIQAQILNLLLDLRSKLGLTCLFISHDLAVVRSLSHRIAVMYLGRIVETGESEHVYQSSSHPYTRALLSAAPVPDPAVERRRKLITLDGDLPSATAPPVGCAFNTRCWLYREMGEPERCRTVAPVLEPIKEGRQEVACHFPLLDRQADIIEPLHRNAAAMSVSADGSSDRADKRPRQ